MMVVISFLMFILQTWVLVESCTRCKVVVRGWLFMQVEFWTRQRIITAGEILAVRYFIEYFRQYLLGRRFKIGSDHQVFVWIFCLKEPIGKIASWLEILGQCDFAIEYRPGKKQGHCDTLSRCKNPRDYEYTEQDTSQPLKCGPCKNCIK